MGHGGRVDRGHAICTKPARAGGGEGKGGTVGDSYVISLDGNPSTGYKWRLDKAGSRNLDIVRVDDLGYHAAPKPPGKRMVGTPAPYQFRITLRAPGAATVAFEYVRPWESNRPASTFEQHITVRGKRD